MTKRKHKIVTDFGDAEVHNKSKYGVPPCFRIWESVSENVRFSPPKWGDHIRRSGSAGYPPFDIYSEWLMDFATITAGQLGRSDWQNFRRMLLLHVPNCDLYCWYCFNDAWEGVNGITVGEVEAKYVIDNFSKYSMQESIEGHQVNILRISGGEPFLNCGLIEDIANQFAKLKKPENAFLWVDTNLHFLGMNDTRESEAALKALSRLKSRTAVHACIHGATSETLKRNSLKDTSPENVQNAIRKFVERKIPIYPRINPIGLFSNEVRELFFLMLDVSETLPLRTYLGPVKTSYKHVIDRMRMFQGKPAIFVKTARSLPNGSLKSFPKISAVNIAIFEWNRLLEEFYGVGYGRIPRQNSNSTKILSSQGKSQGKYENKYRDRTWRQVLLLCKGWEKEVYAQKMLEIMSVPLGSRVDVEFENKWIDPDLVAYAYACPTFHENREIAVLVTCSYKSRVPGIVPLRWAVLKGLSSTDFQSEKHSIIFTLEMKEYATDLLKMIPGLEDDSFFDKISQYIGAKYLPFYSPDTSYFCRLIGFEILNNEMNLTHEDNDQDFKSAVIELIKSDYEAAKRDIYFRIKAIQDAKNNCSIKLIEGVLKLTEGQKIKLVFESCNPNLGRRGYPEVGHAQIRVFCTDSENVRISPEMISLSKYGEPTIQLTFSRVGEFRGEILIEPVRDGARIPSFRIPFHVEIDE